MQVTIIITLLAFLTGALLLSGINRSVDNGKHKLAFAKSVCGTLLLAFGIFLLGSNVLPMQKNAESAGNAESTEDSNNTVQDCPRINKLVAFDRYVTPEMAENYVLEHGYGFAHGDEETRCYRDAKTGRSIVLPARMEKDGDNGNFFMHSERYLKNMWEAFDILAEREKRSVDEILWEILDKAVLKEEIRQIVDETLAEK